MSSRLRAAARVALGAGFAFVAAGLFVFGAPVTAVLVGLPALAAWSRHVCLAPFGVLALFSAPWEYVVRVNALGERLDGPGLSTRDRVGIWLLNVGMAGGGAVAGFGEVAMETLLLAVPDGDGVRTFSSSFPAGSARVRPVLDQWKARCRAGARTFGPERIRFRYEGGHAEWRRGLALDPVTLTAVAGEDCALDVIAAVPVDYPPGAFLSLVETPMGPLGIDEGLYDALERDGWLFPYEARWVWREP